MMGQPRTECAYPFSTSTTDPGAGIPIGSPSAQPTHRKQSEMASLTAVAMVSTAKQRVQNLSVDELTSELADSDMFIVDIR